MEKLKSASLDVRDSNELDAAISDMREYVTKNYLANLTDMDILEAPDGIKTANIDSLSYLYKIDKLVYQKDENVLDKLTTVYNAAFNCTATVVMIIKSDGSETEYYLGTVNKTKSDAETQGEAMRGSIVGNFPGSDVLTINKEKILELSNMISNTDNIVTAVSTIPSKRYKDETTVEKYTRGIENMTDALKGKTYTLIVVADPVHPTELDNIELGYEQLYTQLSPFERVTDIYNESDSLGLTVTETKAIANSINESTSLTNTVGKTNGWNTSKAHTVGVSISKNRGFSAGYHNKDGRSFGVSLSKSKAKTESNTYVTGNSGSETKSASFGTVSGIGKAETIGGGTSDTKTHQYGRSLQICSNNKTVSNMMKKIEEHLERIKACRRFGAFNCAAYVLSNSRETNSIVASNYNSLICGEETALQSTYINTWTNKNDTNALKEYLSKFTHPCFVQKNDVEINMPLNAASVINGSELAIQAGFPRKSISGVTVTESAPFGRNVQTHNESDNFNVGNIYHMRQCEDGKVKLDKQSLAMHTFITGSTGAGKSNTVFKILDEAVKGQIKYLVVEPAKGEYKDVFGGRKDVTVYGTNPKITELLRINPFSFPKNILVCEHIDRLVEIFNVCWPMYAAMPAILKDAVIRAYENAGWDITTSENSFNDDIYPTFKDVLTEIRLVLKESEYSADNKGDYTGALVTRLKSLVNGIYGQIFVAKSIPDNELFDENVIIDLSRVGSTETKSMIMGLLVMKLQEYRLSVGEADNGKLKHVTVLEEAHNLLKRTSSEQSSESANLIGKSVEMLANSIAELRAFGEGFIIADQSPGLLDMSVIRNTNTKIIHRLPDFSDRELVGKAATLNDDQIKELAKLPCGVAAIYQNDWINPVLCKVDEFTKKQKYEHKITPVNKDSKNDKKLLKEIVNCVFKTRKKTTINEDEIINSGLSALTKTSVVNLIHGDDSLECKASVMYAIAAESNYFEKIRMIHTPAKVDDTMEFILQGLTDENSIDTHLVNALILKGQADRDCDMYPLYLAYVEKLDEKKGELYAR